MEAYAHPQDRRVRVSIEASDFSCEGFVHLPGIRLSDVMNKKNEFLVVVDAEVLHELKGTAEPRVTRYDTIFVRKGEIKYVFPLDDRQGLAGM